MGVGTGHGNWSTDAWDLGAQSHFHEAFMESDWEAEGRMAGRTALEPSWTRVRLPRLRHECCAAGVAATNGVDTTRRKDTTTDAAGPLRVVIDGDAYYLRAHLTLTTCIQTDYYYIEILIRHALGRWEGRGYVEIGGEGAWV